MDNVHYLFGKPKAQPTPKPEADISDLIRRITDWAEIQGVDVYGDAAFQIRVADLKAHLQVMAHNSRKLA